ncbi:hypothetical protein TIFTF001_003147 [Ficus carica]|uniref:Uncharacterized protein n=1 Tax=Ficus carica TaxID=3494 RepID=A0AA87ZG74_FICCA|nr:hypothetical protein TIFTF001_003147 [Ficus carica]
MVLKADLELGVLDIIQRAGPGALLSPSQIASELKAHNLDTAALALDRLLRLLSAYSVLTCSVSHNQPDGKALRLCGLAPVSEYFVPNHEGASLAPLLFLMQDKSSRILLTTSYVTNEFHMKRIVACGLQLKQVFLLKDAIVGGGHPCERAHGMNMVGYVRKDGRFGELFKCSVKEFNPILMKRILEIYQGFEGLTSLVDVGGGDGGIEHCAGDMFAAIPKGDAIFMKCLVILKKCYEALPDHGKVIVVDMVISETPETSLASRSLYQFDMFMMNTNMTGKERTETEFQCLAEAAGFSTVRVACSAFNFAVVELFK